MQKLTIYFFFYNERIQQKNIEIKKQLIYNETTKEREESKMNKSLENLEVVRERERERESNNLEEDAKRVDFNKNLINTCRGDFFLTLRASSELEISYAELIARPTKEYPNKNYSIFNIHYSLRPQGRTMELP